MCLLGTQKCALSSLLAWNDRNNHLSVHRIRYMYRLVVSLLALNLTVAIGTLNVIIFYANIVAQTSTLFPSGIGFGFVFIS